MGDNLKIWGKNKNFVKLKEIIRDKLNYICSLTKKMRIKKN